MALKVSASSEVPNGLRGMKRDLLLRLCHLIEMRAKFDDDKVDEIIRAILGISEEHFYWKNRSYFIKHRIEFICRPISTSFRGYPKGGAYSSTSLGEAWSFSSEPQTVFIDSLIFEGIYQWTVMIEYGARNNSSFLRIGTAPSDIVDMFNQKSLLGDGFGNNTHGSCSLAFYKKGDSCEAIMRGVKGQRDVDVLQTIVPEYSFVAIEIDTNTQIVSFVVNGEKIPHAICNVQAPLYTGMSGYLSPSFTSLLFRKMIAVTPYPSGCAFYECKEY